MRIPMNAPRLPSFTRANAGFGEQMTADSPCTAAVTDYGIEGVAAECGGGRRCAAGAHAPRAPVRARAAHALAEFTAFRRKRIGAVSFACSRTRPGHSPNIGLHGEAEHIPVGRLPRMIAMEDCDVLEVSTPELDDVVRVDDGYGRAAIPAGRRS